MLNQLGITTHAAIDFKSRDFFLRDGFVWLTLEDLEMLKKAALAVFGLVLTLSFSAPKAQAEVHVGVAIGTPVVYGSVALVPAHNTYESYGYYDNGYYDNAPYGYYSYDNPYAYGGTYNNRYYYTDSYRKHWRDRDDSWRHRRHEYRREKYEREHDRWHDKHDRDRW